MSSNATTTARSFSVGDKVRLTTDSRHGVLKRGQIGTVVEVRKHILDFGTTIVVEFKYLRHDGTPGTWRAAYEWATTIERVER